MVGVTRRRYWATKRGFFTASISWISICKAFSTWRLMGDCSAQPMHPSWLKQRTATPMREGLGGGRRKGWRFFI